MRTLERGSIVLSILGIAFSGAVGGVAAWMVVNLLGLDGVLGAIVATVLGMVVATALWTGLVLIRQALDRAG